MAQIRMAQLIKCGLILVASIIPAAPTIAKTEVFDKWTTFREAETGAWYAATTSEKNENVAFGVSFSPDADCEPLGLYSVPSASALDRQEDGDYLQTLRFRVDEETTWEIDKGDATLITSLSMNKKYAVAVLYLPINAEFIAELAAGKKLRMLIVESDITDRFDLKGAKVAVAMAQLGCLQEPPSAPDDSPQKDNEPPPVKTTELPSMNSYAKS